MVRKDVHKPSAINVEDEVVLYMKALDQRWKHNKKRRPGEPYRCKHCWAFKDRCTQSNSPEARACVAGPGGG